MEIHFIETFKKAMKKEEPVHRTEDATFTPPIPVTPI